MPDMKRSYLLWNKPPGVLSVDASFSQSMARFPFYGTNLNEKPIAKFTAIIVAVSSVHRSSASLFSVIQSINLSEHVDQVNIVSVNNFSWPFHLWSTLVSILMESIHKR